MPTVTKIFGGIAMQRRRHVIAKLHNGTYAVGALHLGETISLCFQYKHLDSAIHDWLENIPEKNRSGIS